LIKESLDPQTTHNQTFRRPHICHVQDGFAELSNDKSLQLDFSKQTLCHLWIRTRSKCPISSDSAIHKLLDFCNIFVWSGIIKIDNHQVQKPILLKNATNFLHPVLFVSIDEWMICVKASILMVVLDN